MGGRGITAADSLSNVVAHKRLFFNDFVQMAGNINFAAIWAISLIGLESDRL